MYSRVFKNNQVTYGRPYQIKVPVSLYTVPDVTDEPINETEDSSASTDPDALIENARLKCEKMIKEAQVQAEELIEQARQKAEAEAKKIEEDAWQRGYADGMEAAAAQNKALLEEAERIRKNAAEEYDSIIAGMEADILELAVKIARKAVAGELAINKDVILQIVSSTIMECSDRHGAVVKVSPSDCEYLNENRERLAAMAEGAEGIEIKSESVMKPGDCIIESSLGSIDAGVSTRLDKIEETLKGEYEGR